MAWSQILCEGSSDCPGRVVINLVDADSSLVVYTEKDGALRSFPCSLPALLGVQRGTRTHLASDAGECVLSKEADGVYVSVFPKSGDRARFFIEGNHFLISLTKLVEAKAVQRRVSLQ